MIPKPLYKVLSDDASAYHGGNGKWHKPRGKRPGKWMSHIEELKPCKSGYHLCRRQDLVYWLGPTIWIAEGKGEQIECDNKTVWQQARLIRRLTTWNERTARLFACDCAERALGRLANPHEASVHAIDVARRFAHGAATQEELGAANFAANSAAYYAANYAAYSAADSAAYSAAYNAADTAANYAAYNAERDWQTERLFEYLDGCIP